MPGENHVQHAVAGWNRELHPRVDATEALLDIPDRFAASATAAEQGHVLAVGEVIVARQQVQQRALATAVGAGDQAVLLWAEAPGEVTEHAEIAEECADLAQFESRLRRDARAGLRRRSGRREAKWRRREQVAGDLGVAQGPRLPPRLYAAAVQKQQLLAGVGYLCRAAAQRENGRRGGDDSVEGLAKSLLRTPVEAVEGAVEDQQRGLAQDGASQQRLAHLPRAQEALAAIEYRPQGEQVHDCFHVLFRGVVGEQVTHAGAMIRLATVGVAVMKPPVALDEAAPGLEAHVGDAALLEGVSAMEVSGEMFVLTGEYAGKHRFPRAIGAEHGPVFPVPPGPVDAAQDWAGAEAEAELAKLEERVGIVHGFTRTRACCRRGQTP